MTNKDEEYPYNTEFGSGKTPEQMNEIDEENKHIYESPDGGKTVYRRELNVYDEKQIVEDELDMNEIKEKAPIIGEMMEQVNKPSPSENDVLKQKVVNLEIANSELKDILRNMGVSI